jgi:penicillin-binding protein 1A
MRRATRKVIRFGENLDAAVSRLREGLIEDGHVAGSPKAEPLAPEPERPAPERPPEPQVRTAVPEAGGAPPDNVVPLHEPAVPEPARPKPRRQRRPGWLATTLGVTAGVVGGFYAFVAPLVDPPVPQRPAQLSFVTADGVPLGVTRTGGRGRLEARDAFGTRAEWPPVTVAQLPDYVEKAVLAREDHKFREHWGVRPESLAAAAATCVIGKLQGQGCARGGSTLHMQVARGGFRDRPATLVDKALEIPMALWVARRWSRDEVLERYLNDAYWGAELHGLNAAAWRYFRKRPAQLTLSEAALLAGMLSSPNRADPYDNPTRARRERNEVLDAMARRGFISRSAAVQAKRAPLPRRRPLPKPETTQSRAFLRWVAPEVLRVRDDLRGVQVTLDTRLQSAAYAAVGRRLAGGSDLQASAVIMRADGQVLAMIGGRSETEDTGRAATALRSPASTAKLFTYAEALKRGWRPDDTISGAPVTVGDYTPRNHRGARYGELTLQDAFARSANTAAVRLNEELDPERVAKLAARVGVAIPESAGPAAPLGAYETTLLQLTAAYAGLVGNCAPIRPTGLAPATEGEGPSCRPVLNSRAHRRLLQMLSAATRPGATGAAAASSGLPVGGKTGTSAANRDALFVGYLQTPRGPVMVGVWVGADQGRPKSEITGGGLPALIFADLTRALVRAGY